jgi:hypothetical protein
VGPQSNAYATSAIPTATIIIALPNRILTNLARPIAPVKRAN